MLSKHLNKCNREANTLLYFFLVGVMQDIDPQQPKILRGLKKYSLYIVSISHARG